MIGRPAPTIRRSELVRRGRCPEQPGAVTRAVAAAGRVSRHRRWRSREEAALAVTNAVRSLPFLACARCTQAQATVPDNLALGSSLSGQTPAVLTWSGSMQTRGGPAHTPH